MYILDRTANVLYSVYKGVNLPNPVCNLPFIFIKIHVFSNDWSYIAKQTKSIIFRFHVKWPNQLFSQPIWATS